MILNEDKDKLTMNYTGLDIIQGLLKNNVENLKQKEKHLDEAIENFICEIKGIKKIVKEGEKMAITQSHPNSKNYKFENSG